MLFKEILGAHINHATTAAFERVETREEEEEEDKQMENEEGRGIAL